DIRTPVLSPDQRTVVAARFNPQSGYYDLWLHDLVSNRSSRFSTAGAGNSNWPVWSPDGARVAFLGTRDGVRGLFQRPVNGATEAELIAPIPNALPTDWTHDGQFLIYQLLSAQTSFDIWLLPMTGSRTPIPFVHTPASERRARMAPNGKWLAYSSTVEGPEEVYVQTFPRVGGKRKVSTAGGVNPRWSHDGKELFFLETSSPDAPLMSVEVMPGDTFQFTAPKVVFRLPSKENTGLDPWFDVTDDGRFLMTRPAPRSRAEPTGATVI